MNESAPAIDPGSFRDPSGFIFSLEHEMYRAIAPSYFENFAHFINSGLYASLVSQKSIIEHAENHIGLPKEYAAYKVIRPAQIPFISYPYEWCFSQLKDAALLTLKIQKESLNHGMTLKDASGYNIQFVGAKPVFIDTLSFERYTEGSPWKAYGQFCRHFLAPLALMSYKRPELSGLLKNFIDGIPLDLASSLLPSKSVLNSGIASHILLHATLQKKHPGNGSHPQKKASLSKSKLITLIQHLEECISGLIIKENKSAWTDYETTHSYSEKTEQQKEEIISTWLNETKPKTIIDAGCNTGKYSIMAAENAGCVIALDADFHCIENLYLKLKTSGIKNCIPLLMDLSNPSPSIGWANKERKTVAQRGKANLLMALALVHHLRIGNNVPFSRIAEYFSELTNHLIMEFVPLSDKMVQQMLRGREDTFTDYTIENFYDSFERYFLIKEKILLQDSGRTLVRMKNKTE